MSYTLWEFETGNAIGEYNDEAEALAVVRENIRTHGPSVVHGVALLSIDPGGDSHLIAQGEALLQRLEQRTATG